MGALLMREKGWKQTGTFTYKGRVRLFPVRSMLGIAFFVIVFFLSPSPSYSWKAGWIQYNDSKGVRHRAYGFLPTAAEKKKALPMMLLMDPGGNALEVMNRYMPAAERRGWILASSPAIYNGTSDASDGRELQALYSYMCSSYKVNRSHVFLGGQSGGGCAAYAQVLLQPSLFKGAVAECAHMAPWRSYKDFAKSFMIFYLFTRTNDHNAPATRELCQAMKAKGMKVAYKELSGEHWGMMSSEVDEALKWLEQNWLK